MGLFDNASSVSIGGNEVQSIVTSNGGVIYEKPSGWELDLTANKSVMMTGETATLTATLTNNNVGVSGETIYFDGILNSTSTTLTVTNTETKVSSKYDVLTVPDFSGTLYLNKEKNIELFLFDGMIILIMLVNGQRTTVGTDISDISVNNGILSYTENGSIETVDISSYDLSVVSCNTGGTATIGDYGYYVVTDSNGVATVSYTGVGVGDLNVQAVYEGIISSEIYALEDCIYAHDLTTNDLHWSPLRSDGGTQFTSDGFRLGHAGWTDVFLDIALNKPCSIEFDVTDYEYSYGSPLLIAYFWDNSNNRLFQIQQNTEGLICGTYPTPNNKVSYTIPKGSHMKINILNDTIEVYVENIFKISETYTMASPLKYSLTCAGSRHITVKNMKIKAL